MATTRPVDSARRAGNNHPEPLTLISHPLCPYVQRAVISLTEKDVAFARIDIDLSDKPDWFLALSPLGKTPVLRVGDTAIFESTVILEYLEETRANPLHPADPLTRAEHRAWIEFGSSILNDIAGLYNAPDAVAFGQKTDALRRKFDLIEARMGSGPYFAGDRFSLVDAAFGPVFRYFDVFDRIDAFNVFAATPTVAKWRGSLSVRASIKAAVSADYEEHLWQFLLARKSHLSRLMPTGSVTVDPLGPAVPFAGNVAHA